MSEPTEPNTAPEYCSYCGEWLRKGVVVAEIHSDAGAGHTVVRHAEHVGLSMPAAERPRTWTA